MSGFAADHDRPTAGWRAIRHYSYAERPFEDVWGLLARASAEVLGGSTQTSKGHEAALHVKRAGVEMTRGIRLRFGGLVCEEQRARLALQWEDAHHPRLFPILDAVLEIAPLKVGSRPVTQIGIVGRYRPPFGPLGALGDRLAGDDVAEESVAHFLDEVTRRIEALIPPEAAAPADPIPPVQPGLRRVYMPVDRLADQPGGAVRVGRYLEASPGVSRAEVQPLSGLATVEYDPELCDPVKLLEDLEDDRAWPGGSDG